MAHPCDICGVLIGRSFLMCAPHWRLVPPALQRDVYRTWGALSRPASATDKVQAVKEFRTAREAAVTTAREASKPIPTEGASA